MRNIASKTVKVKADKRVREKKIVKKNRNCFLEVGVIVGNITAAGSWSNVDVGLKG